MILIKIYKWKKQKIHLILKKKSQLVIGKLLTLKNKMIKKKMSMKNFFLLERKFIGGKNNNGKKEVLVTSRLSKIKKLEKINVYIFKNKLLKLELISSYTVKICVNLK